MPIELLLPLEVWDGEVVVDYLAVADHPWLRALVETFDACVGRRVRELSERLREPLPVPAPYPKRQAATMVLRRLYQGKTRSPLPPPRARAALFGEAGAGPEREREEVVRAAAAGAGTSPGALWESLFADIPSEREVVAPVETPQPPDLALRTNLAVVQHLIHKSVKVTIRAEGNVRALVRLAKLRGLICTAAADETGSPPARAAGTLLDLSGPLSLFRRTLLYGHALADLVPPLAWCPRFHLEAFCIVRGESVRFALASGAPIFPGREPRQFDSALEERFARDFAHAAPDWELVREPEAFRAGGMLVFPDFLVRHRRDSSRRFILEIVGFWTAEYLTKKFAALRAASIHNLILCIDDDRNCAAADLPLVGSVVRYHRRLDPAAVLRAIEEMEAARPPDPLTPEAARP